MKEVCPQGTDFAEGQAGGDTKCFVRDQGCVSERWWWVPTLARGVKVRRVRLYKSGKGHRTEPLRVPVRGTSGWDGGVRM